MDQKIGGWAFIIGVLLAIIGGIVAGWQVGEGSTVTDIVRAEQGQTIGTIILALVIIGFIVGLLNISDKEITPFLIAAIALLSLGSGSLKTVETALNEIVHPLGSVLIGIALFVTVFVAPAALIVALAEVYRLAGTPKGTESK